MNPATAWRLVACLRGRDSRVVSYGFIAWLPVCGLVSRGYLFKKSLKNPILSLSRCENDPRSVKRDGFLGRYPNTLTATRRERIHAF